MIAYFILVHRYPDQFKRLFKAIYHDSNHYLIHVDKSSGPELQQEIASFLSDYPNASLLASKNALWGGYSLVDAELRGIAALLKQGVEWEFFINLSAQDFPLRTQAQIHSFLRDHSGKDFLKVLDQRKLRPDTLHRIDHYVTETERELICEQVATRPYLEGVIPYIGNQWMILSRAFCEFVSHSPEVDRFKSFYQNTLIADEGFFQTVIMNTSYQGRIVNDDKRAIEWIPMGDIKLRPRDYLAEDATALLQSDHLFARKFDETIDSQILDILEGVLAQPVANTLRAEPALA
ncbi:beta-1,6-N-acetylglucosaminyltransferase [Aeromonas sp.]|uniref:beta-1,6-N-acetylglucosaminyltransferase n=1 Tax=Aeromonas sp. TaxID=647 RepID=UPI00258C230B|nr:beta-1,6-N-acetylglucosaminyltransferase [Aeromonas sp.]MCX7127175.1 glycosyl transferase [Aeromonas sp.]